MRVIINKKSNIGEILSAVYYKSPAMPIGVPSLYSSLDSGTQALLRSSSSLAPGVAQEIRYNAGELGVDYRFFEYGLTSFPSPEGVLPNMSRDMASVLFYDNSDPDKESMWLGMGEFNGFSKYIIPTDVPGLSPSGLKFFGSFRTTTQEIYTFPAGPGISKIELYDINIDPSLMSRIYDHDLGYGDFQNYEPVISIYLGCSKNGNTPRWSNNIYNKDSRYFIGTQENSVDRVMDHDYKLYSERFDSKVIFLAIGQREEDKLQISYNAWLKLYDPLRNKPDYDVLEKEKTNDPEQLGETIENSCFDLASGSYLGNYDDAEKPILSDKLSKIDKASYSRWKRYRAGDTVKYKGSSWTSLCDDNCGNVPELSSKWVLTKRTNDFYTSWFLVRCQEAQEIRPGFKINVPDYQKESMFKLYPKPGYIPTEAVIGRLNADGDIDRAVMTENIDIDELRYYIFYLKWNQEKKNLGALRGKVIDLGKLEKKPLHPTIRIPDILIQNEGGKNVCTWNTKLTEYKIEGDNIVIDSELEVSIFDQVIAQVTGGTGINKSQANESFMSLVGKMKFSLEYIKSIPGKTWETGESEVEPWVTIGRTNIDAGQDALTDIILHEKSVDYEDCVYILIPGWDYKRITISNSGDFDIEHPVFDVVRTENFRSGVLSRNGAVPSEIMIKYPLESGEWSEWQHREFANGRADWMLPGLGGNKVHLDRTPGNPNLYTLQVENVTVNLIIDIKV